MHIVEQNNGLTDMHSQKESTHILQHHGRNGRQQYIDRGFGKMKNTDFEPLHYQDT